MLNIKRFLVVALLGTAIAAAQTKPTQIMPGQVRGGLTLQFFACGVPPQTGSGVTCTLVSVPGVSVSYVNGVPTVALLAPPNPIQRDSFLVNCSTSTNCASGAASLTYKLTGPVASLIYITRNGMVMLGNGFDYTGPDSTGTITFASGQSPQDGDTILAAYFTH